MQHDPSHERVTKPAWHVAVGSHASAGPAATDLDDLVLLETESEALAVAADEGSGSEGPAIAAASSPAGPAGVSAASVTAPSPSTNKKMLKAASSFWQLTHDHGKTSSGVDNLVPAAGSGSGKAEGPADDWVEEAMAARTAALSGGRAPARRKERRRSVLPETLDGDGGGGGGGGDGGDDDADAPPASARSEGAGEGTVASVKTSADRDVILGSLAKSFLFRGLGRAERDAIASAMGVSSSPGAASVLVKQGSPSSSFFVVRSGSVVVAVGDKPVARIGPGGHFGELQLLFQTPSQSTVTTMGPCEFFVIDRRTFRRVMAGAAARTKEENKAFLKRVPLLRGVDDSVMTSLAEALQTIDFPSAGHAIVKEGSVGTVFYIVKTGECAVLKAGEDGEEVEVMRLKEGAFFGEQALLHDKPRAATVSTGSAVTVLALSKDDFLKVFGPAEQLAAAMERTHSQRQEMEAAARSRSKAAMRRASGGPGGGRKDDLSAMGLGAEAVEEVDSEDEVDHDAEDPKVGRAADAAAAVVPGRAGSARLSGKGSRADMPSEAAEAASAADRDRILAQGRNVVAARSMAAMTDGKGGAPAAPAASSAGPRGSAGGSAAPKIRTIPSAAVMTGTAGATSTSASRGGGRSGTTSAGDGGKGRGSAGVSGSSAAVQAEAKVALAMSPTTTAAAAAAGRAVGGLPATQSFRSVRPDIVLDALQMRAVLGEGAFGRVMLVQEPSSREVFALKQMSKARIVKTGQKKNVLNEKSIMMRLDHPHVIRLIKTFQDRDCLYMLIEFAQGGDLFGLLGRVGGTLAGKIARYYASVVASVFAYMHGMSIVYRDLKVRDAAAREARRLAAAGGGRGIGLLGFGAVSRRCPCLSGDGRRGVGRPPTSPACARWLLPDLPAKQPSLPHASPPPSQPENLCLMASGMLKVVDFGFAKFVAPGDRTYTLCGTPEYLAPELISGSVRPRAGWRGWRRRCGLVPATATPGVGTHPPAAAPAVPHRPPARRAVLRPPLQPAPLPSTSHPSPPLPPFSSQGHREGVDWWALGILVYEMLHGYSPFSDPDSSDHRVIYRNILKGRVEWHDSLRAESAARSLVRKLLEGNTARRLGSLRRGARDVTEHRFFEGVDWKAVRAGKVRPPLRPKVTSAVDVSAFDEVDVQRSKIDKYVADGTGWDASF